jgi:O-antigen/teichoic acid export membrane protein
MHLWVGPSVLEQNPWGSSAAVFYVLVAGATVSGWQRLSIQVLLGMRYVELTAGLFAAEAVSNLTLSVVLAHKMGIVGVAWGTTLPSLVFNVIVTPIATCRRVGVPVVRYWIDTMARPLGAVAAAAAVVLGIAAQLDPAGGWLMLVARAAACSGFVGLVVLFAGMSRAERETVVWRPVQRLLVRKAAAPLTSEAAV